MGKLKHFGIYLIITGLFAAAIWASLATGSGLENRRTSTGGAAGSSPVVPGTATAEHGASSTSPDAWTAFTNQLSRGFDHPLPVLLLQMLLLLAAARLVGIIAARLGQPAVMGEIVAGILLGPSFLGMLFPEASRFIFPASSLGVLQVLSQIGLILFMFSIGMELDVGMVRARARAAVAISHAGILFPYLLGVLLSYWLYEPYAPAGVSFLAFGLFMGIAMSITAFPVLARIIQERGLSGSPLGSLALTCSAADDATAWCILAGIVAIVKGDTPMNSLFTLALLILHVALMLGVVKPFLSRLRPVGSPGGKLDRTGLAAIFSVLLFSSLVTELIGIHALFGAFLAGAVMPDGGGLKERVAEKVQDFSLVVLLPLFFALTGLRTQVALLDSAGSWLACGVIIAVAIAGKFGGSAVAARIVGQSWRDACALGILMNTRGLMELVVLNIGYDLGVLSPEIFAMMVIMALVTTFMAGPCLRALGVTRG